MSDSRNQQAVMYFDGSCAPDKSGGYGVHIDYLIAEEFWAQSRLTGAINEATTNNEAEYAGLIAGLRLFASAVREGAVDGRRINPVCLNVLGDSQLVINQMKGDWAIKAVNLVPLFAEAQTEVQSLRDKGIKVNFKWIPREQNKADEISRPKKTQTHKQWKTDTFALNKSGVIHLKIKVNYICPEWLALMEAADDGNESTDVP